MKIRIQTILAAMRMVPLLRSIASEIQERGRAIAALEDQHQSLGRTRKGHVREMWYVEASLADQRRELRRVEKELAHLGWFVDESYPQPVLLRCKESASGLSWRLEEASRQTAPSDSAA